MKFKAKRDTGQGHHARQLSPAQYPDVTDVIIGVVCLATQCPRSGLGSRGVRPGQYCFTSSVAVALQRTAHFGINIANDGSCQQCCIYSPRLTDRQRAHWYAGRHLGN